MMDDFLQVILEETEKVFKPSLSPGCSDDEEPDLSIVDDVISGDANTDVALGHSVSLTPIRAGGDFIFNTSNSSFLSSSQNGDRCYGCKYCSEKFANKSDYSHHLQRSHIDERPFQCLHCGKSFSTKNILKQHERIHTKERPYSCQYCRKTFSHRTALANHIRTHTGEKPYDCSYCEKSFGEKAKLLLHNRVHTGEKPFVCGHCQRAFRDKSSYNVHLRIHTGEKPFMCSYCQRSFTHRNSFKDHIRIHTGERPFVCIHCNRDFAKQSTLRKHLEVHGVVKPFELHVHAVIKPCSTAVPRDAASRINIEHNNGPIDDSETVALSPPDIVIPVASSTLLTAISPEPDALPLTPPTPPPPATDANDSLSPSMALSVIKRMLHFKKKPQFSKASQRADLLSCSLLGVLHHDQTHVCTYCRSLYKSKLDLIRHSQNHPEDSKTWKFGSDIIQLFTSVLGLDAAYALGFHNRSPLDILSSFLKAAGVKPKLNPQNSDSLVLLRSHFKEFIGVVVNQNEQEAISLDQCCMLGLLYDMGVMYPLCDDGV